MNCGQGRSHRTILLKKEKVYFGGKVNKSNLLKKAISAQRRFLRGCGKEKPYQVPAEWLPQARREAPSLE